MMVSMILVIITVSVANIKFKVIYRQGLKNVNEFIVFGETLQLIVLTLKILQIEFVHDSLIMWSYLHLYQEHFYLFT